MERDPPRPTLEQRSSVVLVSVRALLAPPAGGIRAAEVGARRVERPAPPISALQQVRPQGRDTSSPKLGGDGRRLGTVPNWCACGYKAPASIKIVI
jgi:hypothetical protein